MNGSLPCILLGTFIKKNNPFRLTHSNQSRCWTPPEIAAAVGVSASGGFGSRNRNNFSLLQTLNEKYYFGLEKRKFLNKFELARSDSENSGGVQFGPGNSNRIPTGTPENCTKLHQTAEACAVWWFNFLRTLAQPLIPVPLANPPTTQHRTRVGWTLSRILGKHWKTVRFDYDIYTYLP